MTGINQILAKGENRLTKINEVLMKFRTKKHVFSMDISKMYNTLVLEEEAYPYSLFLYHEDMEEGREPDIWVMTVAWYGVPVPAIKPAMPSISWCKMLKEKTIG